MLSFYISSGQVTAQNSVKNIVKQLKKTGVRIASRFADIPYPWRTMEYQTSLMYASVFPPDDRRRILDREIGGAMYIPGSHE